MTFAMKCYASGFMIREQIFGNAVADNFCISDRGVIDEVDNGRPGIQRVIQ